MSLASPTLAETIRLRLAEEITAGRLPPGAEIEEGALAGRFGASRTPVREALRELAAQGMVEITPRRGARVARVSLEKLGELFELLAETEAMCARFATWRMTATERFALQALQAGFQPCPEESPAALAAYDEYNRRFHEVIYRGTHNSVLAGHVAGLRQRLAPYRRAQYRGDRRIERSYAEHQAVLERMLRGAGEEAAQLMRAHMLTASAALARFMQGEDDPG